MLFRSIVVGAAVAKPRRALVPAGDPTAEYTGTNPPAVDGKLILMRLGDKLDIGMDWSAWLAANDGKLKASAWAVHADSPATPTLSGGGMDQAEGQTVTIVDTAGLAVGNTIWLSNSVTIEDASPNASNTYTLPDRTMVRHLHIKVTK